MLRVDGIFGNELLKNIGKEYNKSIAQVILRWLIQRDIVVIPKSVSKQRIIENIDVFDFELTDDDMSKIVTFDKIKVAFLIIMMLLWLNGFVKKNLRINLWKINK